MGAEMRTEQGSNRDEEEIRNGGQALGRDRDADGIGSRGMKREARMGWESK